MDTEKLRNTKNTIDSSQHDRSRTSHLSEADKKKLELGEMMEHEHGKKRERLEEAVEETDSKQG